MTSINDLQFSSDQVSFRRASIAGSTFLEGPAGAGKTTSGIIRLSQLLEMGIPGEKILVFVPQRTLAFPYYQYIQSQDRPTAGDISVLTLDGLAQRMINLFWPIVSEKAGFSEPFRLPTFLTLETAQYHLSHLVRPLILYEGYFQSVTLDRNRLYSQVLDNINKAALVGFPYTEIGERLKKAWSGDPGQLQIYDDVQTCVNLFRQFCLQNNLLDYSLQIECLVQFLLPEPLVQSYLAQHYRHLIADNIEEDTPVAHDFIADWVGIFDSSLLIYDWDGGYRTFLGADPVTGYHLKDYCTQQISFQSNLVASPRVLRFGQRIYEVLNLDQQDQGNRLEYYLYPAELSQVTVEIKEESESLPEKPTAFLFEVQRYFTEMLDWVVTQVKNLVVDQGVAFNQVVILAPYLPDALRFSLQNRFLIHGIPVRSNRPSRPLRDEPATRCLLTLSALAYPEWGFIPERSDVVNALMQAIDGLDLVRAQLLTNIVYRIRDGIPALGSFEVIQPEIQVRISYVFGERYEVLRKWLLASREQPLELDFFISRLFGEVLSQPGYGFHVNLDAGVITANLIESIQKFRWALNDVLVENAPSPGYEYFQTVQEGLVAAQYLSRWFYQDDDEGVLITPAYSFLLSNQPVEYQFWLDISSRGWYERLEQPLTHPYVLSRHWPPGQPWTDFNEVQVGQAQLSRLALGLTRRCKKTIYLGFAELDEQGYEGRGLLLRVLQKLLISEKNDHLTRDKI
jgi:hypothetical protein